LIGTLHLTTSVLPALVFSWICFPILSAVSQARAPVCVASTGQEVCSCFPFTSCPIPRPSFHLSSHRAGRRGGVFNPPGQTAHAKLASLRTPPSRLVVFRRATGSFFQPASFLEVAHRTLLAVPWLHLLLVLKSPCFTTLTISTTTSTNGDPKSNRPAERPDSSSRHQQQADILFLRFFSPARRSSQRNNGSTSPPHDAPTAQRDGTGPPNHPHLDTSLA